MSALLIPDKYTHNSPTLCIDNLVLLVNRDRQRIKVLFIMLGLALLILLIMTCSLTQPGARIFFFLTLDNILMMMSSFFKNITDCGYPHRLYIVVMKNCT